VPTHKPDLSALSIAQLAELTGRHRTTVTQRLREARLDPVRTDGKTLWYTPRLALPVILGTGEGFDPQAEKARLDRARWELAELELAKRRGELISKDDSKAVGIAVASTIATGFLAYPTKVAPLLDGEMPIAAREAVLREHVHELLAELSALGVEVEPDEAGAGADRLGGAAGDAAASAAHALRVGRRGAKAQSRVERRAGEVANQPS
jgi:hypothetical protein